MKKNKIKLILTLGPSSLKKKIVTKLKKDTDIFRLNMSHLNLRQLKKNISFLKKNKINNICIDTEGAQIRTIFLKKKIYLKKNAIYYLSNYKLKLSNLIQLYPNFNLSKVKKNSKVKVGFDGLELVIEKVYKNFIKCKVIEPGFLEANKGVHFEKDVYLDSLTEKDKQAIKIANENGIKIFALSFANSSEDVKYMRSLLGKNNYLISKIESRKGFINRKKIIRFSDAVLIDRGDLSRYIEIPKIPIAQRIIINDSKKNGKNVFVATNLLETMINFNNPTRAESNDIFSSLESGCSGLVLAAETAIGKYPLECMSFLKECIKVFNKRKKLKKNLNFF